MRGELADEEEVSVVSLNEPLPSYTEWTDKDLMDFVSLFLNFVYLCYTPIWFCFSFCSLIQAAWLDGSYVSNAVEPLNGELIVSLTNDVEIKLYMSKVVFYSFDHIRFLFFSLVVSLNYHFFFTFCRKLIENLQQV